MRAHSHKLTEALPHDGPGSRVALSFPAESA
jgi:hypothetical protein